MDKLEIKISKYWFAGNRLHGVIDDHPKLGSCRDGLVQTSRIVKVETKNSVYVLDGPPAEPDDKIFNETRMITKGVSP